MAGITMGSFTLCACCHFVGEISEWMMQLVVKMRQMKVVLRQLDVEKADTGGGCWSVVTHAWMNACMVLITSSKQDYEVNIKKKWEGKN